MNRIICIFSFAILLLFFTISNISAYSKKHINNELNGNGSGISFQNPDDYKLYQNYPNPFNPVTKITYKINKPGQVSLIVFNLVGQVIKVLVDEYQEPGIRSISFDASNLPNGVYLYKLRVNDFTSVKRMTLIK